jgi:hypothetical protein
MSGSRTPFSSWRIEDTPCGWAGVCFNLLQRGLLTVNHVKTSRIPNEDSQAFLGKGSTGGRFEVVLELGGTLSVSEGDGGLNALGTVLGGVKHLTGVVATESRM